MSKLNSKFTLIICVSARIEYKLCALQVTKLLRYSWLTSNESNSRLRHFREIKIHCEKFNLPHPTFGVKIDGTPAMAA